MKEIKLTRGMIVLVDDGDFDILNQWKWYAHKTPDGGFYAARRDTDNKFILMHRFLLGSPKDLIDHEDGNGLNNTRKNIRKCNPSQNSMNRRKLKIGSSKYKGVCFQKISGKWMAYIGSKEGRKYLGLYELEQDAAKAYNNAAIVDHGEFANLNIL